MIGWTVAVLVLLGSYDLPQLWREGARTALLLWLVLAALAIAVMVVHKGQSWYLADWILEGMGRGA